MEKDKVRLSGSRLYTHFKATGETGRISVLPLQSGGLSIYRDEKTVFAQLATTGVALPVEKFPNDSQAEQALVRMTQAVGKHLARSRCAAIAKATLKWGVFPTLVFLAALALNATLNQPQVPAPLVQQAPTATVPAPAQLGQADIAEMAAALQKGTESGNYTVSLSGQPHADLYIFSDPLCPHCKELEPELAKLSNALSIHVFPVSVIGGEQSAKFVEAVLCTDSTERNAMWKAAVQGTMQSPTSCDQGTRALSTNNAVFAKARMQGTPTLVRADGTIMPDNTPHTAEAILNWAKP